MSKNKKALLAVVAVLMVSLSLLLIPRNKGSYASVDIEGETVLTIDLKKEKDGIIDLSPYGKNIKLQVDNHKIRFVSSDCPNKVCVNTGFISREGETAVCLPNKTSITIKGDKF